MHEHHHSTAARMGAILASILATARDAAAFMALPLCGESRHELHDRVTDLVMSDRRAEAERAARLLGSSRHGLDIDLSEEGARHADAPI